LVAAYRFGWVMVQFGDCFTGGEVLPFYRRLGGGKVLAAAKEMCSLLSLLGDWRPIDVYRYLYPWLKGVVCTKQVYPMVIW